MTRVNLSQTLTVYYGYCQEYNATKSLKEKIRTEQNTGHLLLVLMCHNLVRNRKAGCTLYTNLKSISKQTGQSTKTVRRHLQMLHHAQIIHEFGRIISDEERNRFKVVFNPKLIQVSSEKNMDNVWISEQMTVDAALKQIRSMLHPENG